MELSGSNNNKFLIIPQKELFFYFRKHNFFMFEEQKPLTNFWYFLKRKLYLYFGKRNPEKNSLYFRKQNFLIFQKTNLIISKRYIQNPVIFRTLTYSEHCQISMVKWLQKWLLFYIPGNEAFLSNIFLIFQKVNFWAWKVKRNYY